MNCRLNIVALALLAFSLNHPCAAAIPGADNPKAYTGHDFLNERLEFNRRTMVEAYKQVGHHDPKWDGPALALLDGMAQYFGHADTDYMYSLPPGPGLGEMEQNGRAAVAAGCDDPLVLDMLSVVLLDGGKTDESNQLIRKAADGLARSQYPPFCVRNSANRALHATTADPQAHDRYEKLVEDFTIATVKFADYPKHDRRFVYQMLSQDYSGYTLDQQANFCKAIKDAGGDAWMTNLFSGRWHIAAAWEGRGSDVASTVSDDGWKIMATELALARQCLVDAHRLHPEYPEAAVQMITVVMGGAGVEGDTLRGWFESAVSAQLDFIEAYDFYVYAIYPRWHGSHAMMVDFAQECAATERYDTAIPYQYVATLNKIRQDGIGDWSWWKRPGAMERTADILSHYGEKSSDPRARVFFNSQTIGLAWQTSRYDIGRAALDRIDGKFDPDALTLYGLLPKRTVSGTCAFTGSLAQNFEDAEALVAGDPDKAISTYQSIVEPLPKDDPAATWANGRLEELKLTKNFQSGEWVNLIPPKDLAGWETVAGHFDSDGTSLSTTGSDRGLGILCGAKFGSRWELECTIENAGADETESNGGVVFDWADSNRYSAIAVSPAVARVWWRFLEAPARLYHFKCQSPTHFKLRQWDSDLEVSLDGNAFPRKFEMGNYGLFPDNRIGIGSLVAARTSNYKVTEMKIRRLSEPPQE